MVRQARSDVFDPLEVSAWHCINRCVRRCFLCGVDPLTGKNFEHRKVWLEERFRFLAGLFGVDVLGFAILSNHFHLILRNRPDVVATWSDDEVARRWLLLCPFRKDENGAAELPTVEEVRSITGAPERVAELRRRLSHISWFMRMVAEPVARQANDEEQISGRFWQGRFRAVKLCDEAAILACSVYVDLNPIRASLAATPEESNFTAAQRRIESMPRDGEPSTSCDSAAADEPAIHRADFLAPLSLHESREALGPAAHTSGHRCSDKGFLPISLDEYLALLDWTGRQTVRGKQGSIPSHLAPILERIGIGATGWFDLATRFDQLYHRVAGGCSAMHRERTRHTHRQFRTRHAKLLGGV